MDLANAIRFLSIDMVEAANSGHPGMPLGMADVATTLYSKHLKFNPQDPTWFNRDRLILSAGHGCALLYSCLYLCGYKNMTIEELKRFRALGSLTPGHAEYDAEHGIEATTGPLGQGIAMAVGIAMSERILNARFGDSSVNHKTYVICGDGCLAEGIGQEAISIAGHYGLKNLIVLFDDNEVTIDGPTSLATSDDHIKRAEASGWNAFRINGHDVKAIDDAIAKAKASDKPTLIACRTKIGFGVPNMEGSCKTHGAPLGTAVVAATRENLEWKSTPFIIPENTLEQWRDFWKSNEAEYKEWQEKPHTELKNYLTQNPHQAANNALNELKKDLLNKPSDEATRVSSGRVITEISKTIPNLIGGSADLTSSNNTKSATQIDITKNDYSGSYINYGEREHVMAAIMNGIALHGALIPYGGTFLSFADYARPAIRLSAIMHVAPIYIMTHDSIGLGEDGPTHQPVEHLASFRAMPNINVFRPCDAVETLESWQLALQSRHTPSMLVLTRQKVKQLRVSNEDATNKVSLGAYIIKECIADLKVTIFATGSEVSIAVGVAEKLENEKIGVRVISVPCMDLLWEQEPEYQMMLTCNSSLKVAIEAACRFGWERLIGSHGLFFGVDGFGHSAPASELYKHFGLTVEHISKRILSAIGE
ncbi:MAG: transketolase [Candidatus Midichloriaceae bacterium]|jgi:transketolase|nr:transketolase [Candidatus Midichloriaceae bacterium]